MRRRAPILPLLLLAACEVATPPERTNTYSFTPRTLDGYPIVFRWPAASLPVRIWAEPTLDLPLHVSEAIAIWHRAVLYGEFRGVLVRDSSVADVVVRLGEPEDLGLRTDRLDCVTSTRLEVGLDTAIILPFRTRVAPRIGASPDDVHDCLATALAHELGHVLGLFLHSDDPGDLMHGRPSSGVLSARDEATLLTLYHSVPTVYLPPGR